MPQTYSKDFFKLQLEFAKLFSIKHKITYEKSLFFNTCLYVRLLGYNDEHPPKISDSRWKKIIKEKPTNSIDELNYIYKLYLNFDEVKGPIPNQKGFGCFSYSFHKNTNKFELHFRAKDEKGNLGKDRQNLRLKELTDLFKDIKARKINTTIFIITWLLNIPAFCRLFP